jgi:hypothetical protein
MQLLAEPDVWKPRSGVGASAVEEHRVVWQRRPVVALIRPEDGIGLVLLVHLYPQTMEFVRGVFDSCLQTASAASSFRAVLRQLVEKRLSFAQIGLQYS